MRNLSVTKDYIIQYCYSDEERLQAIDDLGPDPEITRFKGLGEISPEEFINFIGPDIRLDQVTLNKGDQVAKMCMKTCSPTLTSRLLTCHSWQEKWWARK